MPGALPAGAAVMLDALVAAYPWLKRHTGDPGSDGTANPASDTARADSSSAWASASGASITTNAEIDFGTASATETYTYVTGWTAETGGSPGWSGTVSNGAVTSGTGVIIGSGDITVTQTVAS